MCLGEISVTSGGDGGRAAPPPPRRLCQQLGGLMLTGSSGSAECQGMELEFGLIHLLSSSCYYTLSQCLNRFSLFLFSVKVKASESKRTSYLMFKANLLLHPSRFCLFIHNISELPLHNFSLFSLWLKDKTSSLSSWWTSPLTPLLSFTSILHRLNYLWHLLVSWFLYVNVLSVWCHLYATLSSIYHQLDIFLSLISTSPPLLPLFPLFVCSLPPKSSFPSLLLSSLFCQWTDMYIHFRSFQSAGLSETHHCLLIDRYLKHNLMDTMN